MKWQDLRTLRANRPGRGVLFLGRRKMLNGKCLIILVGVAGFEPATPASRTQQTPPDAEQLQRLNETQDDGTEHENLNDLGPSCKSRSNSTDSFKGLDLATPDSPDEASADAVTPVPPN